MSMLFHNTQSVVLDVDLVDLHMPIYVSDCYSCLATGGMLQELFTEIPLLVLMPRLATKLNLVYSRSLVTKPQEESQEGFKLNFIT